MATYTIALMRKRFDLACKDMGWNNGPWYTAANATEANPPLVMNVGNVKLERWPGTKPLWRIVQLISERGGERHLSDNYTVREMVAFLDGLMTACDHAKDDTWTAEGLFTFATNTGELYKLFCGMARAKVSPMAWTSAVLREVKTYADRDEKRAWPTGWAGGRVLQEAATQLRTS